MESITQGSADTLEEVGKLDSLAAEKIKQEQLSIVNKYAKGPASGDDETDNEIVYSVTDQYGFLHKTEPTPLPKQEEDRRKLIEVKRRTKWLKMVRNWEKYVGNERLVKRVYKGIPHGMKDDVWRMLLGVNQYMENMPDVYQEMKTRAHSHSPDIKQIDMDVNRTYRDHVMFKTRFSIKQQQLFHVLAAYSMYNTEVGYCQGMSQIAALLLMYMSEEEAFWALHSLLYGEKHKMHGFFIPGFPKLMRFQKHHDHILKKFMPKLKKHLDENEVFASLYTMKWFFQCFLDRTPFSLTLRLWDIYILEGEKLLTSMSYAILKMHKAYIKSQDMDGIVSFLQEQLVKDFGYPDDTVVEYLKGCMIELKRSGMDLPPPQTDAEKPKLPFGTYFQPNFDKSAVAKTIPQFAKHSVDIDTLVPDVKRKGSNRKKGGKVKRGMSTVAKSTIVENGLETPDPQNAVKGSKSFKDPVVNRSPFLRRSMRKQAKTEKKKKEDKKKHSEEDKKKAKSKPKDSNPHQKTIESKKNTANEAESIKPITEQRLSPTLQEEKHDSSSSNGQTSGVTSNGKHEGTEQSKRLSDQKNDHRPSPNDSTYKHSQNETMSVNNSNNFQTGSSTHHTRLHHPHSHVAVINDTGTHAKSFLPPLLHKHPHGESHRNGDSDADRISHANEHDRSSSSSANKVKIMWRTPHKESSTTPENHQHTVSVHHNDDSQIASKKKAEGVLLRSHSRPKSSDILGSASDYTLQKKTPSFSQLFATLDSIENLHQSLSDSGGSPTSNNTTSPGPHSNFIRPQSFYDNVTYPYNPPSELISSFCESKELPHDSKFKSPLSASYHTASVPVIPESPDGMRFFSAFDQGVEGTSGRISSDSSLNNVASPLHHRPNNTKADKVSYPVASPRRDAPSETQLRPRSMGDNLEANGRAEDSKGQTYARKDSKSMENLRQWTYRDKGRKKHAKRGQTADSSVTPCRSLDAVSTESPSYVVPMNDIRSQKTSSTSPFQKAVEDTGILQTADKLERSRKMSREEIVTAAILSQMKGQKTSKKGPKSPKYPAKNGPMNVRHVAHGDNLAGWEAEGGKMLSSPVITAKSKKKTKGYAEEKPQPFSPYKSTTAVFEKEQNLHGYSVVRPFYERAELHSATVLPLLESDGWGEVDIDGIQAKNPTPAKSSNLPIGSSLLDQPPKGVAYYTRHNLSAETTPIMSVSRYDDTSSSPTSPEKWIDITKLSPDHSPAPLDHIPRRSPHLSKASKADINELLSAGINANPVILFRYESAISNQNNKSSSAGFSAGQGYVRPEARTEMYLASASSHAGGRRRSVNMAVQTEESRVS